MIIKNIKAHNNFGIGVLIENPSENTIIDNVETYNNKGDGFVVINTHSLYQTLGIPDNTPPEIVKEIITSLAPNSSPSDAESKIKDSLLTRYISNTANISAIAANFSTLASTPHIQLFIQHLNKMIG